MMEESEVTDMNIYSYRSTMDDFVKENILVRNLSLN